MTEAQQPIASMTKEIVPLMFSIVLSNSGVMVCPPHDVSVERSLICASMCASTFDAAF